MKVIQIIAAAAFVVGFILIVGAVGTDDYYVMELHQMHTLQMWQIVKGLLLCMPAMTIGRIEA